MRFLFISLLVVFSGHYTFGQFISNGPVVGGVTENSARIYLKTNFLQSFVLEVDTDPGFPNPLTFNGATTAALYNTDIVDLGNLQANTKYFYRFNFGGSVDSRSGSFRTFPAPGAPGNYKFVVGSCNYSGWNKDVLFGSIKDYDPHLFIHLGDWGWPPNPLGTDYNLFPDKVAQSFEIRYNDYNMSKYVLPNMPVDYVYDDDYTHNDNEGWTYPQIVQVPLGGGDIKYDLRSVPIDSGIRRGAIRGYFDYFPGYAAVDTNAGVHHTFKMGNVEFFILDTRNSKSPRHEAFVYDSTDNGYSFQPGPDHSTLGPAQRAWLLDALKNSTADWKVIGSSVVFNKRKKSLLNYLLLAQLGDRAIIEQASGLAYMWVGFPEDTKQLLQTIQNENIEDVLMISGDTHSSMIDDGSNSGIPELSSSGLAAGGEGYLNWSIDSVVQEYGINFSVIDSLWNAGGSGIQNQNFSDTYATMEFFGKDSVKMCVIDEFDQTLACLTLTHSSFVVGRQSRIGEQAGIIQLLYPNPAKETIRVLFTNGYRPVRGDFGEVLDLHGRVVMRISNSDPNARDRLVSIGNLPSGAYQFVWVAGDQKAVRKFVKR